MVARGHVSQVHGHVLVGVVHVLLHITFFCTDVVHHTGFQVDVPLGVNVEGHGCRAVFNFAELHVGHSDIFAGLSLLLFIRDGDRFQGATVFHVDVVCAVNRVNHAAFIFHPDTYIAVCCVDRLRQIECPLICLALRCRGDSQFGAHGSNFTVSIEETRDHFVAWVDVVTGDLAVQGMAPLGNYCRGFVWGDIAAVAEINVDCLVEAVSGIGNFPYRVNNLVTGTLRNITAHFLTWRRCLAITVNSTEWGGFKLIAGQRFIWIPVLLGNIPTPVNGFMRCSVIPGKCIFTGGNWCFSPGIQALAIKLGILRNTGAGKLSIWRQGTCREARRTFHALWFILNGTAVDIFTELTHISAAGRRLHITMC